MRRNLSCLSTRRTTSTRSTTSSRTILLEQNEDLREAHEKSLDEMEELKRFQGSTLDTISRRKLIEDRDTILELTAQIQELQIEVNCMNDSRDFQDAESVRSGQSHVTSQPVFSPPFRVPGGMPSRSVGMPSRKDGPPSIWDTHGISGNVFCKSNSVFFKHLIFRIFISTNSPRQQHSLVGRYDSRLRYVLVHNFQRRLCCGSKKWRWLIQWIILNLRYL